ncbi:MAG: ABC transporter permease [Cuniculiplasma divulgatum]|jgi:ABC-type dipeptide/oligopeptide/nickel transport system permease component|nr:MAG: ABC transporter permease [Cuniculiplasma divulgatum]
MERVKYHVLIRHTMELRYFIIRRLLVMIPTLIGLLVIVFALLSGIPKSVLAAPYLNPHSSVPKAQQLQNIYALLGLNQPPPIHFFIYVKDVFTGNLGIMNLAGYPSNVLSAIELAFPNTVQLALFATLLSIVIAIPLGTYIGARPNSLSDQAGRIFSLSGYSMPAFWLGILLIYALGSGVITGNPLGVLPYSGSFNPTAIPSPNPTWFHGEFTSPTHLFIFDALLNGAWGLAWDGFKHVILPVITLTYTILAGVLRFIRAGMVDSSYQEYVKTARAKGVPEKIVIKRHIRRNALIPSITVMGLLFSSLLGGVVIIEDLFAYPGIGMLAVNAAETYQVYGVLGTTFFFGIILIVANLIVDVVYAFVDPRIRY